MASAILKFAVLLVAFLSSAQAHTYTVSNGTEFLMAARDAGDGDSIVLAATFTITRTAVFTASVSIFGGGSTILVTEKSYGIYIRGSTATSVYIENLPIDGTSVARNDPVLYIAGSSGAKPKTGPTVTLVSVTIQNVNDRSPTIYYGRGAALEANTGSTVNFTGGAIMNNYAEMGGAVESTGNSFVFFCNTLFSGNTAGEAFASFPDYWVGRQSHIAIFYNPSTPGFATPPSGQLNNTQPKSKAKATSTIKATSTCPTLAAAFQGIAPYPAEATKATKVEGRRLYGKRHPTT